MMDIRKSILLGLAVVFVFSASLVGDSSVANAQDKSLEDRVAALEAKSDNFGFSKRPYIQSDDGRFRIEFGGRLQARYTLQVKESRGNSGTSTSDESFAELERARLSFRGNFFSKDLKYKVEADGHSDAGSLGLADAYVQYRFKKRGFSLGAGQWKPFFGRQEQTSSSKQLLVDRSLANEFFNVDRNQGVWLSAREKLGSDSLFNGYSWQLGVSNGIDSVNRDVGDGEFDHIPAVIAHFDVDILGNLGKDALSSGDLKRREEPGLTAGFSLMTDQNNGSGSVDPGDLQYGVYQVAYDAVYKSNGFNLNAEYFQRWLDIESAGFDTDAQFTHGAYVEGGYMVTDALQLVTRGSTIWDREASGKSAVEAGGGINYFVFKHNLKLSADVLFLDIPGDMSVMTERLPGHDGAIATPADFSGFSSSSANLDEFQGVMLRCQAQVNF